MCPACLSIQRLHFSKMQEEAIRDMLEYGGSDTWNLYSNLNKSQTQSGFYFVHEHPSCATGRGHLGMRGLLARESVLMVIGDMCLFGMT